MKNNISINQWIKNYDNGDYDDKDVDTQCKAGWYDWFCSGFSLANKTKKLAPKVKIIGNILGKDFCENHYVFFKNNCPMVGSLYDDFRFCNKKSGNVIFTITPKSGHKASNGLGEVWGKQNDFDGPLIEGTWSELILWFQENK